jgi:glucokinase
MTAPIVGLDIGGTKLAAALVDEEGKLSSRCQTASPVDLGPDAMVTAAAQLVRNVIAAAADRPAGLGVATAGVVDARSGVIRSAVDTIPGWAGVRLGPALEDRLGLPTAVENDGNAVALAEARLGAARGKSAALIVSVGTGVGGALVLDGCLWRGRTGTAGEIGHLPVDVNQGNTAVCNCGRPGHLEALVSGPAIARAAGQANLEAVSRAWRSGDQVAARIIADAATTLGRAIGGLANVIDPDVIVLTGGVLELGQPFFERVNAAVHAETLPGPSGVTVLASQFGRDAGIVGAALAAADHLRETAPDG